MAENKKQILRDTVCVFINDVNLSDAIAVARDMRGCTRTLAIGPTFFLANGPNGVRCFFELGIHNILLDLRLIGSPAEIWKGVIEAADMGVKGITVSALTGPEALKIARTAALASRQRTLKVDPLRVIVVPLPEHIADRSLVDDMQLRVRRRGHIESVARMTAEAGLDGVLVEYDDILSVKRATDSLGLLVHSQRSARDYTKHLSEIDREKPGITEVLKASASHVLLNAELMKGQNIEWQADLILKELAAVEHGETDECFGFSLSG
jgi:orotidine-5'-phosphate decarboxylase